MSTSRPPVGVVLAGGAGRRMGGGKAVVELGGRPLVAHVLAALRAVVDDVAVVCKRDTVLPASLRGTPVWTEPDTPRHPLTGIVHALRAAGGRPVLACAVDLPLLGPALLRRIATTDPEGADAIVPAAFDRLQPLCALYFPTALVGLSGFAPGARVTEVVGALRPLVLTVDDDEADDLQNVNAPEDLLRAAAVLDTRRRAPTAAADG